MVRRNMSLIPFSLLLTAISSYLSQSSTGRFCKPIKSNLWNTVVHKRKPWSNTIFWFFDIKTLVCVSILFHLDKQNEVTGNDEVYNFYLFLHFYLRCLIGHNVAARWKGNLQNYRKFSCLRRVNIMANVAKCFSLILTNLSIYKCERWQKQPKNKPI